MKKLVLKAALCAGLLLVLSPAASLRAEENTGWVENMPKALAQAKAEKKLVFVDFTGSDWCPACKLIDKELFSDPGFKQYAQEHLILLRLDFPQETPQDPAIRKQNQGLVAQYNPEGVFPLIMLLNGEGKLLTRDEGYIAGTAQAILTNLKKVKG